MDGDIELEVSMSDTWHVDSNKLDKSMGSSANILNVFLRKIASSPKKNGKEVEGRSRGRGTARRTPV